MTQRDPHRPAARSAGSRKRRKITDACQIEFPVDAECMAEARRLIIEDPVRMRVLGACAADDPVMVIEFIKTVNGMDYAAKEGQITDVLTALLRLGTDVVVQCLHRLATRPALENPEAAKWLDFYRVKGRRCSVVAGILSEVVVARLSSDCHTAGGLVVVGDMLAAAFFQEEYPALAVEKSRPALNYFLAQHRKFDPEKMGLRYLWRNGLPDGLTGMLDRDAEMPTPERARARTVCYAAVEMVEAFDADRWERLAPDNILPPKSCLRSLYMNHADYARVYERVGRYLFELQLAAERKAQAARELALERGEAPPPSTAVRPVFEDAVPHPQAGENPPPLAAVPAQPAAPAPDPVEPEIEAQRQAEDAANVIASMFELAGTTEDLLRNLLGDLVQCGLFKRSALLLLSEVSGAAMVVAARGEALKSDGLITLDDPASPLARCFAEKAVQAGPAGGTLFGCRSFALAQIKALRGMSVALYADCGLNAVVSPDTMQIFQILVETLNRKLPELSGSVPFEAP